MCHSAWQICTITPAALSRLVMWEHITCKARSAARQCSCLAYLLSSIEGYIDATTPHVALIVRHLHPIKAFFVLSRLSSTLLVLQICGSWICGKLGDQISFPTGGALCQVMQTTPFCYISLPLLVSFVLLLCACCTASACWPAALHLYQVKQVTPWCCAGLPLPVPFDWSP